MSYKSFTAVGRKVFLNYSVELRGKKPVNQHTLHTTKNAKKTGDDLKTLTFKVWSEFSKTFSKKSGVKPFIEAAFLINFLLLS